MTDRSFRPFLCFLNEVTKNGWRWEIGSDPKEAKGRRFYCDMRRGSGPPPYGQYLCEQASNMNTLSKRVMREYANRDYPNSTPFTEKVKGDAFKLAVRLLSKGVVDQEIGKVLIQKLQRSPAQTASSCRPQRTRRRECR